MRQISLDRLRTLITIADYGSFAEAARVLHLAPPTISLHISDLEARIGATLLSRQRGRVVPSTVGETLIAHARKLLMDADQAVEEVRRQAQGLAGRVRLGASTSAIAHHLPRALEQLSRQHPGIDLQISVLTSEQTLTLLADGALDVGLVALPQSSMKGLAIEPWRKDPVMAFIPADWPLPAPCHASMAGQSTADPQRFEYAALAADVGMVCSGRTVPDAADQAQLHRCGQKPGIGRVWCGAAAG